MSLPFTFGASLPTLSMPRIVHGWVVQSASGILAMTWTSNDEEEARAPLAAPEAFSDVFARFQSESEDSTVKSEDLPKGEVIYLDDEMASETDSEDDAEKKPLSKKCYRNTIPIPAHWSAERDYLQGKHGIEKPIFKLPSYIAVTGIATQRDAIKENWVPPSPPTTATTADAPTVTDKTETKLLLYLLLTIYTVDTSAPATPSDVSPPTPHPYSSFALLLSPAVAPAPTSPSPPKDTEASTAHLLASHATSFDPQMVLSTLPSRWPLCTLSLYLVRTLRQNLAVTDTAHEQLHAVGTLVEEALDEDEDKDVGMGIGGEKVALDEKTVMPDAPASIAAGYGYEHGRFSLVSRM
ncbi:protein of unknown function (DUF382) domain containing protein [Russula decolorans]